MQVYTNTAEVEKRLNRSSTTNSNMSTTSSEDTNKDQTADNNNAFETVADALHLQWSVIGKIYIYHVNSVLRDVPYHED